MSYSFSYTGERAAVKRAVENDPQIPDSIKAIIRETVHDRVPEHSKEMNGVTVSGFGHVNDNDDSAMGSLSNFFITPIKLTLALLFLLAMIAVVPRCRAESSLLTPEKYSAVPVAGSFSQTAPVLPTPQQIIPPNATPFDTNGMDFTNVTWKVGLGLATISSGEAGYVKVDADLWALKSVDIGLSGNTTLGAYNQGFYSAGADLALFKNLSNFQLMVTLGVGGNFQENVGIYGEAGVGINYNLTKGTGLGFLGSSSGNFTYCFADVKVQVPKFQFAANGSTFQKIVDFGVGYAF